MVADCEYWYSKTTGEQDVVISSFNVSLVSHGDTMSDDIITHVKMHVFDVYAYMHVHA